MLTACDVIGWTLLTIAAHYSALFDMTNPVRLHAVITLQFVSKRVYCVFLTSGAAIDLQQSFFFSKFTLTPPFQKECLTLICALIRPTSIYPRVLDLGGSSGELSAPCAALPYSLLFLTAARVTVGQSSGTHGGGSPSPSRDGGNLLSASQEHCVDGVVLRQARFGKAVRDLASEAPLPLLPGASGTLDPSRHGWVNGYVVVALGRRNGSMEAVGHLVVTVTG
jgi:hypothetical protein